MLYDILRDIDVDILIQDFSRVKPGQVSARCVNNIGLYWILHKLITMLTDVLFHSDSSYLNVINDICLVSSLVF